MIEEQIPLLSHTNDKTNPTSSPQTEDSNRMTSPDEHNMSYFRRMIFFVGMNGENIKM